MAADERYPSELRYHPEHDWARIEQREARFGITWFAQDTLGEIVHWEVPANGDRVVQGEPYTELESVKAVSDIVAPLSGEIVAVNGELADSLSAINDDPYGGGWLVQVRISDPAEADALLDADAYRLLVDDA